MQLNVEIQLYDSYAYNTPRVCHKPRSKIRRESPGVLKVQKKKSHSLAEDADSCIPENLGSGEIGPSFTRRLDTDILKIFAGALVE